MCPFDYKQWYKDNKERLRRERVKKNLERKQKAIYNYGTECDKCGETDLTKLGLYSTKFNKWGQQYRELIRPQDRYRWIIRNGYPDIGGLVVCSKCKSHPKIINHRLTEEEKRVRKEFEEDKRRRRAERRKRMLEHRNIMLKERGILK